jgi:hypothetical protein
MPKAAAQLMLGGTEAPPSTAQTPTTRENIYLFFIKTCRTVETQQPLPL